MYDLYVNFVEEKGFSPVKLHFYHKIYCNGFNFSFNKSLKDLCDLCAEICLMKKEKILSEVKEN